MSVPGCRTSGELPNMPIFVYMLRRCGTLKTWVSPSKSQITADLRIALPGPGMSRDGKVEAPASV